MFNPLQAGNKVYRGGSNHATHGTVDPSGYIEREMRKRMFGLQNPQQRSRLAEAALRRSQNRGMSSGNNPGHHFGQIKHQLLLAMGPTGHINPGGGYQTPRPTPIGGSGGPTNVRNYEPPSPVGGPVSIRNQIPRSYSGGSPNSGAVRTTKDSAAPAIMAMLAAAAKRRMANRP